MKKMYSDICCSVSLVQQKKKDSPSFRAGDRRRIFCCFLLLLILLKGCGIVGDGQNNTIEINGHTRRLKSDLRTYLLLGIDTEGSLQEEKQPGMGGQSDAIYLLVCDMKSKSSRVIGIPRDTMTEIRVFLPSGKDNGVSEDHLTLQYAFGNGKEQSCLLTEEAVSKLMFNIPIDGYLAVNLGAVPDIAEALGGVEVVVPDDSARREEHSFVKGAVVTLDRTNVKKFLRFRDTDVSQSAITRMERHKAFFRGCLKRLRTMLEENPAELLSLYHKCSSYFLTDISPEDCVKLAGLEFNDEIDIIPGEKKTGELYDEFYVDQQALGDMVEEIFCR